jgi:hypothetical protein
MSFTQSIENQFQCWQAMSARFILCQMAKAEEVALLRKYREDFLEVRRQIRDLQQQRDALQQGITGLESMLRFRGIDPDQIDAVEETDVAAAQEPARDSESRPALINSAVAALESVNLPTGAKALHALLLQRGVSSNYYTLYKNLAREAKRDDGLIVRNGEKFGLRKWATNDTP